MRRGQAKHNITKTRSQLLARVVVQHAVKQSGEVTGTLVISADETLFTYRLPTVLRQFRLRYPGIRLMFRPLVNSNFKQSLRKGDADIVFMLDEPFYLLAAPDHPLAALTALAIEDFNGETFLLTAKGMGGITELEFISAAAIKQCSNLRSKPF